VACTSVKRRRSCVFCGAIHAVSATNGAFHATIRHKNELIFNFSETEVKNDQNAL
jgi:hypothetical protein